VIERFLYRLTLTPEGEDYTPNYEINSCIVVCAQSPKAARKMASAITIDESPETWLNGRYSYVFNLGRASSSCPNGVICREDNAS
jgi:hypothetical protein